jgi:release factor glutamine methyltransferase
MFAEYGGINYKTSEEVYEPSDDTFLAAEQLLSVLGASVKNNLSVLDMGCGTGLLGLIAAKSKKVQSVLFCDVDSRALELASDNVELNRRKLNAVCTFTLSNLFSEISESEKFDIILFNTPYLPKEHLEPKLDSKETAWDGGKGGIEIANAFISQASSRLPSGGMLLLVSSSFADLEKMIGRAKTDGYELLDEKKKHIFFEDIVSLLFVKK